MSFGGDRDLPDLPAVRPSRRFKRLAQKVGLQQQIGVNAGFGRVQVSVS